ncbi:FabA-like domain protein [Cytobacillus oceanisediminis]|uniref:FabA-like domain protein n=1 Tax=Cytobacillus oceanisediminis TaxID=665099 RepID=UPI001C24C00B|nr:FabA-like domain protein [Cytobacillus oceanisediminis]MBU8772114.1 FabA-like domain protein [Cytobacillus oceanisediminis]
MKLEDQLPYQKPFILIDKVIASRPHHHISTLKVIATSDIYLWGHFPSYSIYPGMLLLEGVKQSSEILIGQSGYNGWSIKSSSSRFIQPVVPGDIITYYVEMEKKNEELISISGIGKRELETVVRVKLEYTRERQDELRTIN